MPAAPAITAIRIPRPTSSIRNRPSVIKFAKLTSQLTSDHRDQPMDQYQICNRIHLWWLINAKTQANSILRYLWYQNHLSVLKLPEIGISGCTFPINPQRNVSHPDLYQHFQAIKYILISEYVESANHWMSPLSFPWHQDGYIHVILRLSIEIQLIDVQDSLTRRRWCGCRKLLLLIWFECDGVSKQERREETAGLKCVNEPTSQ